MKMAFEVKPWKNVGLALSLDASKLSQRETYSREINEAHGEGGGLNANYRTLEAALIVANRLGVDGMIYGDDLVFKTGGDTLQFDFRNLERKTKAELILRETVISQ